MLNETDLLNIEREIGTRSLGEFSHMAWAQVEARKQVRNWHMDAMSDHLQAVSRGDIRRLIINIPPRHTKSLTCNVFWQSWDWIENPWRQYLFATYRSSLSERDNKKANRLLSSKWYQDRFEPRIDPNNNTTKRWGIFGGGERLVTSVGGASSTGEGGDIIVIDDPISADDARYPVKRKIVIDWWDETIKSRLNDAINGAFVVIMQRLHEGDLTGHILAHETGWDHLCLPARYDPKHPHPIRSSIGFVDPRKTAGELLNPKRFTKQSLDEIAPEGTYAAAGQLQQRPAPRGGGTFKREWFEVVSAAPAGLTSVRGWDLAASKTKEAAFTAGVRLGYDGIGTYYVEHVTRGQLGAAGVTTLIKNTASQDDQDCHEVRGSLPQDPGAGGKVWAQQLVAAVAGYNYRASPESGDKETRAEPVSAQAEAGNIKIVKGEWNKEFLDELELFPSGKFKDQVDALSRAFMELVNTKKVTWYVGGDD
jgi:predicted phage terminase large subunit-like protein